MFMIIPIKKFLRKYPTLYKRISHLIHIKSNYWKPSSINSLNIILDILNNKIKEVSFIQIGSNDGVSGDPLHNHIISGNWRGILIEPIPFLFNLLKDNYHGYHSLEFENCAVGSFSGTIKIYSIDESKRDVLPEWYFQLASFDKKMLYKHGIPNVEDLIKTSDVHVQTIDQIIAKSNLQTLNLMHIDTEGFDYEILKTVNFFKYRPEIILFEHCHLINKDYKNALLLLKNNKFKIFRVEKDTVAIRTDFYIKNIKYFI